jgi:hypothetical protein
VKAVLAEPRQVTRAFHPEPEGDLLPLPNGSNAEVLVGEPAYQVTSGEIVAITVDNP